eukprot:5494931-Prymnesium_polylepis.1
MDRYVTVQESWESGLLPAGKVGESTTSSQCEEGRVSQSIQRGDGVDLSPGEQSHSAGKVRGSPTSPRRQG